MPEQDNDVQASPYVDAASVDAASVDAAAVDAAAVDDDVDNDVPAVGNDVPAGDGMALPADDPGAGAATLNEPVVPEPLVQALKERDEYLEALRRVQADFENYRKRMVREQTSHLERATEGLIEQLLPVLDAFQLALLNAGGDAEKLQKGVELVYAELLGVLERSGIERIQAEGKPFDPTVHEAVMSVEGDGGGDPVVVEEMRTGWRLKGRVLRPSMVKVSK